MLIACNSIYGKCDLLLTFVEEWAYDAAMPKSFQTVTPCQCLDFSLRTCGFANPKVRDVGLST